MPADDVILDVVGADEAREILHVELQRISRWRHEDAKRNEHKRLPPVYTVVKCSPVWVRRDIEAMARNGNHPNGFTPPPSPSPLLGTYEISQLLKVDKSQIARWRRHGPSRNRPVFPEPATEIKAGRLWLRTDILAFARARAQQRRAAV